MWNRVVNWKISRWRMTRFENEIKEQLHRYRDLKGEYNKSQDEHKHVNLVEKYKIIDEIKELVKNKESINRTFQEFRDLQKRWRTIWSGSAAKCERSLGKLPPSCGGFL